MTARTALFCLCVLMLLAGASTARGQESGLYDPAADVIGPDAARWVYLGTLFYEAPAWSASLCSGLGLHGKKATAVHLLADPGVFFGFLWATRRRETTLGMVSASHAGTIYGFGAGLAVGDLLLDWGQRTNGAIPKFATATAASLAGHIIGLRHAEREQLNFGNVDMLCEAGAWSALYSGYVMWLPIPFGYAGLSEEGVPLRRKLIEAAAVAGWSGGLYYWHKHGPRDYTAGDAISTWNSDALGALTAAAAWSLLRDETRNSEWSFKTASLLPAAVNAGGLLYGYRFHRMRDVTLGQSLLVSLGTVLGAASVGTAIALLATPEGRPTDGRIGLWTAAAGGWFGFHLTHKLLDTDKPKTGQSSVREPRLQFSLMPGNALGVLLAARTGTQYRAPLLCAEF